MGNSTMPIICKNHQEATETEQHFLVANNPLSLDAWWLNIIFNTLYKHKEYVFLKVASIFKEDFKSAYALTTVTNKHNKFISQ